ncbi:MAG: nucleotidyltransferase domain-containing protein [Deltaproteobacteria bacterium]|nr:nucleotidyltransferase domain-containing protein [Deltaproteobacteria bacterium]
MRALKNDAYRLLEKVPEEKLALVIDFMRTLAEPPPKKAKDCGHGGEGIAAGIPALRTVIHPIAERYGVDRVYLFGSRARGDNRPDSDYDFLISKGKVKDLWLFAALIEELETTLNARVDVITDTSDDENLIAGARQEGVLLYERTG